MRTAKTAICEIAAAAALAVLLLLSSGSAGSAIAPQQVPNDKDYALIYGTVWDASNHPAYGVPIKIRRADEKKPRWRLMSDHSGEFAQRVPTGRHDYIVWADVKTGKGKAKPERKVHVENNERVDISLHLTE